MSELISRKDVLSKFEKACTYDSIDKNGIKRGEIKTALTWEGIRKILKDIPSEETEQKKGKWVRRKGSDCWECSQCHAVLENYDLLMHNFYFCYHCGANMMNKSGYMDIEEGNMSEKLKRCPFCGGEVDFWTRNAPEAEEYQALIIECKDCPANMEEWVYKYDKNFADNFEKKKAEMFEAWNRQIERTAKMVEHDATVTDTDGYKYHRTEYLCDACKKKVIGGEAYCSHCGSRLIWGDDDE